MSSPGETAQTTSTPTARPTCASSAKRASASGPYGSRHLLRCRGSLLGAYTYVYAPKSDPLHRSKWRDPYGPDALARFAELAQVGRAVGVDVVWAVSPGLDIDAQKPEDVSALLAKVESVSKG